MTSSPPAPTPDPAPPPSLAARPAIFLIRVYQVLLGPFLGGHCRFSPSCSVYGIQALERHGLFKGVALTVWRLLRCNPLCKGGYDPP